MRRGVWKVVAFLPLTAVIGCATIVGSPTHVMPISSTPSEATVVIVDEKGTEIFKGATPTQVTLQKSNGTYWGKKSYKVTISKDGFETQTVQLTASANGWYIGGNFIFGGLIGWFIVDPLNGHMYNLSPENISASLAAKTASGGSGNDGSIAVMLMEDVPADLREKMKRID